MSRIIKASMARFSERPDSFHNPLNTSGGGAFDAEAVGEAAPAAPDPDIQAAYDELIAAAQDEVAAMLRDARDNAQILLKDAEKQAGDIRRNGYEEGYRLGLGQVREDTMEIIQKAERDASGLIAKAQGEHDRILHETEPRLLKLALEVAEKILHHELEGDDGTYMSILSNALGAVKAESKVVLRVNPSDYVRYFNSRENAKIRTVNGNVTAQVTIDSSVDAGGCLIETDSGAINSSPAAQISQIANTLGVSYGENGETSGEGA